jgi:hypothetical protein
VSLPGAVRALTSGQDCRHNRRADKDMLGESHAAGPSPRGEQCPLAVHARRAAAGRSGHSPGCQLRAAFHRMDRAQVAAAVHSMLEGRGLGAFGPQRRAGQGPADRMPTDEAGVYLAAGFTGLVRAEVRGQIVTRTADELSRRRYRSRLPRHVCSASAPRSNPNSACSCSTPTHEDPSAADSRDSHGHLGTVTTRSPSK